jgi:hypothetical protein
MKTPFNLGAMWSMSPALKELNPRGTCFQLCCLWVKELLRDETQHSSVLKEKMCNSVMPLALRHKRFMAAIDAPGISKEQRCAAWIHAIDLYNLTSASLGPAGGVAASRVPDSCSAGDVKNFRDAYLAFGFSEADIGDMWGAVWKYLEMQQRPYACIFNVYCGPDKQHQVGGHAISVFIPAGGQFRLRIYDMNGGEWLIECQDHWRTWSNGLDASMAADKDGPINFVEVMDLQRK